MAIVFTQEEQIKQALITLKNYVYELGRQAGYEDIKCEAYWESISKSEGALKELSYFHDYSSVFGQYTVAGYTLPDIVAWQVDHFKAYMDRGEDMNRYNQNKLLLDSLFVMSDMENNPDYYAEKMREESGTDRADI